MNAIITAATGYGDADLQPFLVSVDRNCSHAKVFLIVYERDRVLVERLSHKYPFIEPVYVSHKLNRGGRVYRWIARHFIEDDYLTCGAWWKIFGRYSLHIMLERFFLALELVQAHRNSFRNVLLTDSRDVVFQQDPFSQIGQHLISGLEEKTIGDCTINSDWMKYLYGNEILSRMSGYRIVCAGVTLGPVTEVEKYLLKMCGEIWRCLSKVALLASYDQGIHNYLIYSGQMNLELTENQAGIIATLHHEDPNNIQTDTAAGVVIVQGKAPAIVHQYDRHRHLVSFFRQELTN